MIDCCFRRFSGATLLMALTENGCLLVVFLIYDVRVLTVKYRCFINNRNSKPWLFRGLLKEILGRLTALVNRSLSFYGEWSSASE